jgi:hypothetical protein
MVRSVGAAPFITYCVDCLVWVAHVSHCIHHWYRSAEQLHLIKSTSEPMAYYCIETYRGTATGWSFAGSRNYHTKQRAEHLLSLHRRIDPDRFLYRISPDTSGLT